MASLKPSSLRQKLTMSRSNKSSGHNTPKDTSDAESVASAKSGLSQASSSLEAADDAELVSRKYVLRVTAGPSYDAETHKPVMVNSEEGCEVENECVRARIRVRIRKYKGLPKGSQEASGYFNHPLHKNDRYSVEFSFVPKQDLPTKDIVWGNDFDTPIRDRLPPAALFNTAFGIMKRFVDPGLSCDAYSDKPWMYSPALSCWTTFNIGEQTRRDDNAALTMLADSVVVEGAEGSGVEVREDEEIPDHAEKRRKYFLDESNRDDFDFEKGRVYRGDYFGPYVDFNKLALKLPGFSLSVLKYMNDKSHVFRYTCKNVKTNQVYFVVCITLLFGEDIADAMEADVAAALAAKNGNGLGNGNGTGAELYVDEGVD